MKNPVNIRIWKERHFQINITAQQIREPFESKPAQEFMNVAASGCAASSEIGTAFFSHSCDTAHFIRT